MTTKGPVPIGKINTDDLSGLLGDHIEICRSARAKVKNPLYLRTSFGTFTPMGATGQAFLAAALEGKTIEIEAANDAEFEPSTPASNPSEPEQTGWLSKLWSNDDE